MAKRRLETIRPLLILGAFLALWWLVPPLLKNVVRIGFAEFHAPAWVVSSYLEDLQGFWGRRGHSKQEFERALREVARQKALYQLQAQENSSLKAEIGRLEQLLDLPPRDAYRYEVARVVRRDLTAWWQHVIIRKGRNFGIPEGAAAVFAGGVAGRVVEVGAFTSRVELVSSPMFRMAARFEGDERPVVYRGVPQATFAGPRGVVADVPQDIEASERRPARLVSTPLGGTFPEGLTIGRVDWLEPGSSGIFKTGEVRLDDRLLRLREVAILVPFPSATPDDAD